MDYNLLQTMPKTCLQQKRKQQPSTASLDLHWAYTPGCQWPMKVYFGEFPSLKMSCHPGGDDCILGGEVDLRYILP